MSQTDSPLQPAEIASRETPDPFDWEEEIHRALHAQNDGESHVEQDPRDWHPSQLSRCKRQAVISAYGLEQHDTDKLGIFKTGTLIHEWLETTFEGRVPGVSLEHEIETKYEVGGDTIRIIGQADVWDSHTGVVYDWKTRGGWYNFDPPKKSHLDQLALYMGALGAEAGQVVYLSRKDLDIKRWPKDTTFEFDERRHTSLLTKAAELRDTLQREGIPESVNEVPFAKCGCYLCQNE